MKKPKTTMMLMLSRSGRMDARMAGMIKYAINSAAGRTRLAMSMITLYVRFFVDIMFFTLGL